MKLLESYLIPNGNGDSIWTIITVNVVTVIIIFAFDRRNHHGIVTKLFSKEQNMRQADNKPAVTCHSQNRQHSSTFSSPLYMMEFLSSCKNFIQVVYLLHLMIIMHAVPLLPQIDPHDLTRLVFIVTPLNGPTCNYEQILWPPPWWWWTPNNTTNTNMSPWLWLWWHLATTGQKSCQLVNGWCICLSCGMLWQSVSESFTDAWFTVHV